MSKPASTSGEVTPQRLMQLAWGFAPPLMIEAAMEQGVFVQLDRGPATVDELAAKTGASPRGLRAILNALVSFDLIARDNEHRYSLAPESAAFLVEGKPGFQGGIFKHVSKQLLPAWMQLAETVKTGRPAHAVNQQGEGSEFFQTLVEDIFPMSYRPAQTLAAALKISSAIGPVRVLDLAAGSGVWGIALAQASPRVTVTAVDWPSVLPVTRRMAQKFGITDRLTCVAGDLLAPETDFGTGHSVATLGHILHSEGEKRSRELLKKTFAALAPAGTIAIAEFVANDDRRGPASSMIFAVNMLVNTETGDTFTLSEMRGWLAEAGFVDVRTLDSPGPSPLILATKP